MSQLFSIWKLSELPPSLGLEGTLCYCCLLPLAVYHCLMRLSPGPRDHFVNFFDVLLVDFLARNSSLDI